MAYSQSNGTRERRESQGQDNSEYFVSQPQQGRYDSELLPKSGLLDEQPDSHSNVIHSKEVNTTNAFTEPSRHNGLSSTASSPPTNMHNISEHVMQKDILIPSSLHFDHEKLELLRTADLLPPVTKKTLVELDLGCITNNIKLRTDANYDHELHFRPNLDGPKGKKKLEMARQYWQAMTLELQILSQQASDDGEKTEQHDSEMGLQQTFEARLPSMFEALRELLQTLVPEKDHPSITQHIDVPLLMQQIGKGVFDMVGLAKWLAGLFKTHCAPMRDKMADDMVELIETGLRDQDMVVVTEGLEKLFEILETMKLDVANHQIRTFRFVLIDNTTNFLQEYFLRRISENRLDLDYPRRWYAQVRGLPRRTDADHEIPARCWPVVGLCRRLSEGLLAIRPNNVYPETFDFDIERLRQLRSDTQDLINLEICCFVFNKVIYDLKRLSTTSSQTFNTLQSRIWSLLEQCDDRCQDEVRWQKHTNDVALEIARAAHVVCGMIGRMDADVIMHAERLLSWCLDTRSPIYLETQKAVQATLDETMVRYVRQYILMSPLAICESQRAKQSVLEGQVQRHAGVEAIGRRVAHIGVLHWRVWAPILHRIEELESSQVEMDDADDLE